MTRTVDQDQVRARADAKFRVLRERAEAAGVSMLAISKRAGVTYSVPMRWTKEPPKTLQKLAAMELALDEILRERNGGEQTSPAS